MYPNFTPTFNSARNTLYNRDSSPNTISSAFKSITMPNWICTCSIFSLYTPYPIPLFNKQMIYFRTARNNKNQKLNKCPQPGWGGTKGVNTSGRPQTPQTVECLYSITNQP